MRARCPRCARWLTFTSDAPSEGELQVTMQTHACDRYLVAELWRSGECQAVWTSEFPGHTGPKDSARMHHHDAAIGWQPPPEPDVFCWAYRWETS